MLKYLLKVSLNYKATFLAAFFAGISVLVDFEDLDFLGSGAAGVGDVADGEGDADEVPVDFVGFAFAVFTVVAVAAVVAAVVIVAVVGTAGCGATVGIVTIDVGTVG
jgi:hypothetical protein